jgi:hypothetical protein
VFVRAHEWKGLPARGVGVDLELCSKGCSGGVETAAEDAVAVRVLAVARPDDDEVSVRGRGHDRLLLESGRVRVDAEFAPLRDA